jgi:hypothetical protein
MADDRPIQTHYLFSTADLAAFVEDVQAGKVDDLADYLSHVIVAGAINVDDERGDPVAVLPVHPTWLRRQRVTVQ